MSAQHGTWYAAQLGLFGGETPVERPRKSVLAAFAELDPGLADRRQRQRQRRASR
jgi:hypothetical protein